MTATDTALESLLDLQQTMLDQWQCTVEAGQAWSWPVTAETMAALVEQQGAVQRHGLELTRELTHVGWATVTPLLLGGEATLQPTHTAIDVQFDLLGTLHADTVEAARDVYASPSSADDPIHIDIESGVDESSTDGNAEAEGDTAGDAAPADATIEYAELVTGTIPEVQERVETQDVDIDHVIAAERAGEARVTLLDWLEAYEKE